MPYFNYYFWILTKKLFEYVLIKNIGKILEVSHALFGKDDQIPVSLINKVRNDQIEQNIPASIVKGICIILVTFDLCS